MREVTYSRNVASSSCATSGGGGEAARSRRGLRGLRGLVAGLVPGLAAGDTWMRLSAASRGGVAGEAGPGEPSRRGEVARPLPCFLPIVDSGMPNALFCFFFTMVMGTGELIAMRGRPRPVFYNNTERGSFSRSYKTWLRSAG